MYVEKGIEFAILDLFKSVAKDYIVAMGREVKWVKNDKVMARARSMSEGCKW